LMRAYCFSTSPVLVEGEHAKSIVVTYDSAMRKNIRILLTTYSPSSIMYEEKRPAVYVGVFQIRISRVTRSQECQVDCGVSRFCVEKLYTHFSHCSFPLCILCEGVRARLSTRATFITTYPVSAKNVECIVVSHDSAIKVYIPVILIIRSHLCVLCERARNPGGRNPVVVAG
jgi:hypothetical protein